MKKRGSSGPYKRRKQKKPYDTRLEEGVKEIRSGSSLARAARLIKVAPKTLRRYLEGSGVGKKVGQRWTVGNDRRLRPPLLIFSSGRLETVTVKGFAASSRVGHFMSAVAEFDESNDPAVLAAFEGEAVTDARGRHHPFETRPNVLRRLLETEESFESIYDSLSKDR